MDYLKFEYWITGDQQWMNRWHCTGGDLLLTVVTVFLTTMMFALYLIYAVQNELSLKVVKETHYKTHHRHLRNVFVVCGFIHIINSVFAWYRPIYWIGNLVTLINIIMCVYLIRSKSQVLSIQEILQGQQAIAQVENALMVIQSVTRENLHADLDRIESVLRRSGVDDGRGGTSE